MQATTKTKSQHSAQAMSDVDCRGESEYRLPARRSEWTPDHVDVLKNTIAKECSDDELKLFIGVCKRTGLDPFSRQIYAIKRKERRDDLEKKLTIQVSVDGFRVIADRSGKYRGQEGPFWCDKDGKEWREVWTESYPPYAAKVGVLRSDFDKPVWGVARWKDYKQDGFMWQKMDAHMLAKCAESLALRKAFPQDLSGLYTDVEPIHTDDHREEPHPQRNNKPAWVWEDLSTWENRRVPDAWLPACLRGEGVIFRQTRDPKIALDGENGMKLISWVKLNWENSADERQRKAYEHLAKAYQSKSAKEREAREKRKSEQEQDPPEQVTPGMEISEDDAAAIRDQAEQEQSLYADDIAEDPATGKVNQYSHPAETGAPK